LFGDSVKTPPITPFIERVFTLTPYIVWLPQQSVLFSGDIVYIDRMLGVGAQSNSRDWLTAFDALAALKPEVLVPGHGPVTTLKNAQRDTRDYLVFLRQAVGEFIDYGGGIENIGSIDQTRFKYLANFDELRGRNAQQVFQELEWE
jgi:glyoxylase-like metal-dependent hydrolase (beta-lactamase superfamily II)